MTWDAWDRHRRFGSAELPTNLAERLLPGLEAAHRSQPFSLRDPRAGIRRVIRLAEPVGLVHATIRGSVTIGGVEVDHIWLALAPGKTTGGGDGPWVVDPSLPLHLPSFAGLLSGYVAGDVTLEVLDEVARQASITDRVIGRFPPSASYRGAPVLALGR